MTAADVFDALVSRRPYKEPWPFDAAVDELRRQNRHALGPDVVDAFLSLAAQGAIAEIMERFPAQEDP